MLNRSDTVQPLSLRRKLLPLTLGLVLSACADGATGPAETISIGGTLAVTESNSCAARPADLVAWWPGDGTYEDIIGGHTLSPSATGTSFPTGWIESALGFDGSTGRAESFSDLLNLVGGAGASVATWVRVAASLGTYNVPLAGKWGNTDLKTGGYGLFLFPPQDLYFFLSTDGATSFSVPGPTLELGVWYYLVGTYEAATATMSLYVDGVLVGQRDLGQGSIGKQVHATAAPWVMAAYNPSYTPDHPAGFAGALDETQVFSRALSADEVASLFNAGSAGVCKTVNRSPLASIVGPSGGDEGQALTFDASGSVDPDGDALTYAWDFNGDGVTDATTAQAFFTFVDEGTYSVSVTVRDGKGGSGAATAAVSVLNLAPAIGPVAASLDPVLVNAAVTIHADFSDAGVLDMHTAVIDWDAGSSSVTSAGAISESSGAGTVSGSHSYTTAGVYTVSVVVTDDDGGSSAAIFEYVVVYDPEAGFVTGGGWIESPMGGYLADPSLSGRASFGFVSRYASGATRPSGVTQFQFRAADLTFHSASYEWLVVSGPKAQYKGSGTINGGGDYGFLLTANDGQISGGGDVDRFRIKIWDKVTGAVVYDNQIGDPDDADASTSLGAGSIVIQK